MFFDFFKFKIPKGAWLEGKSDKKFFSEHKNTRPKTYTAFGRGKYFTGFLKDIFAKLF